jgi:hypothetical protein
MVKKIAQNQQLRKVQAWNERTKKKYSIISIIWHRIAFRMPTMARAKT